MAGSGSLLLLTMLALQVGETVMSESPWQPAFAAPSRGVAGFALTRPCGSGVCRHSPSRGDTSRTLHAPARLIHERVGAMKLVAKAAPSSVTQTQGRVAPAPVAPSKMLQMESLAQMGGAWGQAPAKMTGEAKRVDGSTAVATSSAPLKQRRARGIGKDYVEPEQVRIKGEDAIKPMKKGSETLGRSTRSAGTSKTLTRTRSQSRSPDDEVQAKGKVKEGSAATASSVVPAAVASAVAAAPAGEKKRRSRGFGSSAPKVVQVDKWDDEDVELTNFAWSEGSSESSGSWGEEEEWPVERDALADAVSAPPGSRLRSRTAPQAYVLPSSPMPKPRTGRRRETDEKTSEILRRSLILTSGRGRLNSMGSLTHNTNANPGAAPPKTTKKGAAEEDGVISLAELSRRELLCPSMGTQSVLASDSDILKEIRTDMSVFALQTIGSEANAPLLTAGSDAEMVLWNRSTWSELGRLKGHTDWVNAVAIDEDKGFFCTASDDKTVRVWDIKSKKCKVTLQGHKARVHSLAIGERQLFVGCESNIYVWDVATWKMTHRLQNHSHVLRAMSKGKQMSKNVDVDQVIAGYRLPSSLFGHRVGGVVIHKPFLLTAVDDGSVWVWDMHTMEVERKLIANTAPGTWVRPLVLVELEDSKTKKIRTKLVSGWADGAIRTFDLKTWKLEEELYAHNGPVLCLDASDGRLLSTGSDMSVLEWDTSSWKVKRVLRGHRGAVCAVTGQDGETYTASLDGFLKVWNKENSEK